MCHREHAAKRSGPCISHPFSSYQGNLLASELGDTSDILNPFLPPSPRALPALGCLSCPGCVPPDPGSVEGASHLSPLSLSVLGLPSLVGIEDLIDLSGTNDSLWLRVSVSGNLCLQSQRGQGWHAPSLLKSKVGTSMAPLRLAPSPHSPLLPAVEGQSCRHLQLISLCEFCKPF